MNPRLSRFLHAIDEALVADTDEPALVTAVGEAMATLVACDDWLPVAAAIPHPQFYQQHLLYIDPQSRYSLVSFVWGPGQQTPVHDHCTWGVVGMLRGSERSTSYRPNGDRLDALHEVILRPGDVLAFTPACGDIHQVRNAVDDAVSISIHCYGSDIGQQPRHVFDPATGDVKQFVSGYSSDVREAA